MCRTAHTIPTVGTIEEARALFHAAVANEDYRDNYREAFADDVEAMARYEEAEAHGCCGYADMQFMVGDRLLWLGCNYGH